MSKNFNKSDVLYALSKHVGKDRGVHPEQLLFEIRGCYRSPNETSGERRIRTMILELRIEGKQICGRPETGYFIASNENELRETCDFLNARAITTFKQTSAMLKKSIPEMVGQMPLDI